MALPAYLPVPNVALIADDAQRDAIWRRWLQQFSQRVSSTSVHNNLSGLQGGTTAEYYHLTAAQHSTVTSFGTFTNNRVLITGPTSSITTSADLTYNSATSTLTVPNATINGPTLSIGASTWSLDSNYTATRDIGTAAAGTTNVQVWITRAIGNASGNTTIRGQRHELVLTGANNFGTPQVLQFQTEHAASSLVTNVRGFSGISLLSSSGSATNMQGVAAVINVAGSGNVNSNADTFQAIAPTLNSTGTVNNLYGYRCLNMGNTLVSTAVGFAVVNFTNSAIMRGFVGELTSGTGKANIYMSGTAENILRGNVRIGSTVSPTAELDVTGNIIGSGGIALATLDRVSTYTVNASDFTILANASGAAFTVTLPHSSTLPNKIYIIKKTDSTGNAVTVSSVVNIDGATTTTLPAQFDVMRLQSNTTQWWKI